MKQTERIVVEQCPGCDCYKELETAQFRGKMYRVCYECACRFEDIDDQEKQLKPAPTAPGV